MKIIQAFKCHYCGKVYEKNQSCRSHESKCYFNPKTRSCASCAFKIFGTYRMPNSNFTKIRTCLLNIDISHRLKTKCEQHVNREHPKAAHYINQNKESYLPDPLILRYMKKLMNTHNILTTEESEKKRKEQLRECYYNLHMHFLMITTLQKVHIQLSKDVSNRELESNFDIYLQLLQQAERSFSHLDIEKTRTNQLIRMISDNWIIDNNDFSKVFTNGIFTVIDFGLQINELLLPEEKALKAESIMMFSQASEMKDYFKNMEISFDNTLQKYFSNFEKMAKTVDPEFIADIEKAYSE